MTEALLERLAPALSDRYRIERELGRGGMATVFLAEDLKHHRPVALKVLSPEVAAALGPGRFLREIETVAKLHHPHVLALHDSGEAAGLLYYVMPFVEGESLRDRLNRDKQLPVEEALRITREVADALTYAHGRGLVHRDIKPENILLESGHALLADFGIARAVAAAGGESLTTTGVLVGTPTYMSPEQVAGAAADARSDVYALGCVLYEMLAGQAPYTGPTVESVVFQHLNAAPPKVTAMRPAVPAGLEQAIVKALAKAPADRFATTGELVAALAVAPAGQARAGAEAVARPGARRWLAPAAVGVVVAAVVATAAWQEWWPFDGSKAPPPARKDWILVADFDGPPGDSTVAPAAKSLLSAALDQSQLVATVPSDLIREALRSAGKPPNTRVDAEVARELAYRSAVRAVLEGSIGRLGKGYTVVLKVVDVDTPRVILTRSGTAKDDDDLIPVIGGMAEQLRRGLGENRAALRQTRRMEMVATPSFEAYRIYLKAGRWLNVYSMSEAIRLYRRAIALDPGFASAWSGMAYAYNYLGFQDSAHMCRNEVLRHKDRLTARQLQELEVWQATGGDPQRLLAAYDRILADNPGDLLALCNSNDPLWATGRIEEALARTRKAIQLSPFAPWEVLRSNEARGLMFLRRFDEARAAVRPMADNFKYWHGPEVELAAGEFAAAESIATANQADPRFLEDNPEGLRYLISGAQFGRGDVRAATATIDEACRILREAGRESVIGDYSYEWIHYSVVSSGALPLPPDAAGADSSAWALLARGLRAAARGDRALAERSLAAVRARPRSRGFNASRFAQTLLEARIEALSGRPGEAVRLLRPFDRFCDGTGVSPTWVHWRLADAFEQMSTPDSAAFYLERTFKIGLGPGDGVSRPWVHHRLALLYARLGRVADAERHLAAVEEMWDRPDPAVRRMLEEARAAVRSARGMARPSSRKD